MTIPAEDLGALHEMREAERRQRALLEWAQGVTQSGAGAAPAASGPASATAAPAPPVEAPSGAGTAAAVAKDLGRGALEAIPQATSGALEGLLRQPAAAVKDLADWVGSLPGLRVNFTDPNYPKGISLASGKEIRDLPGTLETLIGKPVEAVQGVIGEPQSHTGGVIKSIAQFVAPFLASGGIGSAGRLAELGTTGAIAAPLARGALVDFAAFDPHQKRLSDLVQQVPALANPVTEYLASSPEDSDAEGRFKQAIEGMGLGLATEGLTRGVRVLRSMRGAKQAAGVTDDVAGAAMQQAQVQRDTLTELVGDPTKPALAIVQPAAEVADDAARAALDPDRPGQVFVNWGKISSPDDVKAMVQELADARGGNIDAARRGVRSWEATKLSAATKDAWETLQSRKAGQPLGADETFAVRELWVRSGAKVRELAQRVAANGGEIEELALRKQILVHNAIQEQVIAARTETARALNAWAIPAGDTPAFAGQIDQLRALAQGDRVSMREVADRIVTGTAAGLDREVDGFIEATTLARAGAAARQAWYFGLLSNPKTHVRNLMGNTAQMLLEVPETRLAAAIGKLRGAQSIPDGEAMERLYGLVQGYQDMWSISAKSRQVFDSALEREVAGNPEAARALFAEEADNFFASGAAEASGGVRGYDAPISSAFEDLAGPAFRWMDTVTTAPGRALQRSDELFKSMAFNAEIRGLAYRQASQELASGKIERTAFADRLAEILSSPSDSMRLAARQHAQRQTFSNAPLDTPLWQAVQKWHRVPVLGDITLPFARTPYNIATQVLQRTPLAPFAKSWRQDILAGGARADQAWSRFVMGNGLLLTAANAALNGQVTGEGPTDPAERAALRRQGWQPWSVKVGDRYFDYRSLGTLGNAIGLAANTAEILKGQDWDDAEDRGRVEQLVVATSMALAAQVSDQSFMSGMSTFFDALGDPQRHGEKWWQQLATSAAIPRGVAQLERVSDPNQRLAWDIGSAIRSQTPGLSKDLPPARDLWGRPITSGSGFGPFYDTLSPIGSSKLAPQPIDAELSRLEKWVELPPRKFTARGGTLDLTKNPRAFSRYVELAGNAWKPEGRGGLMDELNALVTGKSDESDLYEGLTDGPDGSKAALIDRYVRIYREGAKRQLLEEFPELAAELDQRRQERLQELTPQN